MERVRSEVPRRRSDGAAACSDRYDVPPIKKAKLIEPPNQLIKIRTAKNNNELRTKTNEAHHKKVISDDVRKGGPPSRQLLCVVVGHFTPTVRGVGGLLRGIHCATRLAARIPRVQG